jgi:hypothetical protein
LLTRFAVRARFAPALRLVRLLAMKQSYSYLCHKSMKPATSARLHSLTRECRRQRGPAARP